MLLRHAVKLSFIKMTLSRKWHQLITRHEYFFKCPTQLRWECNTTFFPRRHVMLPKELAKRVPKTHLMSETEWRNLGVQQSQGWVHYMIHQPGNNWQRHDFKYWFGSLCLRVGVWWCSLLIILNWNLRQAVIVHGDHFAAKANSKLD